MFTEKKINLMAMNVRTNKQGTATIEMNFRISNQQELRDVMEKLKHVRSVIDVERSMS
jgi:GTP pyrophosphokinase